MHDGFQKCYGELAEQLTVDDIRQFSDAGSNFAIFSAHAQ